MFVTNSKLNDYEKAFRLRFGWIFRRKNKKTSGAAFFAVGCTQFDEPAGLPGQGEEVVGQSADEPERAQRMAVLLETSTYDESTGQWVRKQEDPYRLSTFQQAFDQLAAGAVQVAEGAVSGAAAGDITASGTVSGAATQANGGASGVLTAGIAAGQAGVSEGLSGGDDCGCTDYRTIAKRCAGRICVGGETAKEITGDALCLESVAADGRGAEWV